MMRGSGAVLTGIGLGVGLIYYFDSTGRRRGGLAQESGGASAGDGVDRSSTSSTAPRLVAYRASGVASRLHSTFRRPADDDLLIDRLRGQISRAVSQPDLIEVEASDRHIILRGPIPEAEVDALLEAVERGSGVREIVDDLDVHRGEVPGARGDASELGPLLLGAAGTVLAGYGASRRDVRGMMLVAAGAGLLAGAASNRHPGSSD